MNRVRTALLVASLSLTSGAVLATSHSVYPEAAPAFPPIQATDTYMDRYGERARLQASVAGPASASMFDPIQAVDTYMLRHLHGIETQRGISFPSSGGSIDD